jgi:hypothetical protein
MPYDDIAIAMDQGDILVRGLERDDDLWRLLLAHAEAQWRHRVVLAEPKVLPPFVWVIDARFEDWEQRTRRLESLGVPHAGLAAALGNEPGGANLPSLARALTTDEVHLEELRREARAPLTYAAERLAQELGLHDAALGWEPPRWSADEITRERLDHGLRGGLREQRLLASYVTVVVTQGVGPMLRRTGTRLLLSEIVKDTLLQLYRNDARLLRAWDPATMSFEQYLSSFAEQSAALQLSRGYRMSLDEDERP